MGRSVSLRLVSRVPDCRTRVSLAHDVIIVKPEGGEAEPRPRPRDATRRRPLDRNTAAKHGTLSRNKAVRL